MYVHKINVGLGDLGTIVKTVQLLLEAGSATNRPKGWNSIKVLLRTTSILLRTTVHLCHVPP